MGVVVNVTALLLYPLQAEFFAGTGLNFGGGDYILWAPIYWIINLIGGSPVEGFGTYGVASIIIGVVVLLTIFWLMRSQPKKSETPSPAGD
jgi:hypothetical protein